MIKGAHHTALRPFRRPDTSKRPHRTGADTIPHQSLDAVLLTLLGYLVGSISTAVLVARAFRLADPRRAGSHNPGATNVLRLGGRIAGLLTLCGDMLKGVIPPALCLWLDKPTQVVACAGIAAIVGHMLPVYFGFQGGKGVATGIGVFAVWHWPVCVVLCVTWLVVAAFSRYSSLASMLGFLAAAIFAATVTASWAEPVLLVTGLILYKHRTNLQNLREGREPRLG